MGRFGDWGRHIAGALSPYAGKAGQVLGGIYGGPLGSELGARAGYKIGDKLKQEDIDGFNAGFNIGTKSWLTDFENELEKGTSSTKIDELLSKSPHDIEKTIEHFQGANIKKAGFTDPKDYLDTLKERSQTRKKTRDMTLLQPGTKQTILTTGIRE